MVVTSFAVPSGRRAWLFAALALALMVATWHMLRFRVVVDDAFIAFRVAQHWAQTGTPEYNPGVREWVPTSFLWVAALAGLAKVVPLSLPVLASVLGGACGLATIALLAFGFPRPRGAGVVATILCGASSLWAAWPLSGLETSAFALSVLAAIRAAWRAREKPTARRTVLAGALAGGAVLLRPDGAIVAGLSFLFVVMPSSVATGDRRRVAGTVQAAARFAAALAVVVLPMALYLGLTFGSLLPVSSYAKLHGLENLRAGDAYLLGAARADHVVWALPFAVVAVARRATRRLSTLLLATVAAWCALVAVEGGDFMPYDRFLHPIWPLLMLIVATGIVGCGELLAIRRQARGRKAIAGGALVLAGGALVLAGLAVAALLARPTFAGADLAKYRSFAREEQSRTAIGRFLAGKYPPGDWLALKPAGIIPYYSGMRAIDLFCIVDEQAARHGQWVPGAWPGHQRMNAARVHDVRPSIVILETSLGAPDSIPSPLATDPNHGRTWLEDPRAALYDPARVEIAPGRWMNAFLRRTAQ